ncbi:PREDICTED: multidrug resistance-associated protein 5-like [Ceratosolen solmsi marchali]|uniref:Multidrug resistance-associated protein 5-like n=1 Tax=Ceratosolen solmsi marchali TaxID=326594 RepID=A0AAJ6YG52_9HYME|nr:PREDICTED: multidrug resistance-associated protein 5-like [Ceratosolen solmsi marchali]
MKYIFKAKRYFASVQNIYDYLHTLSFENSNRIQAIIPDYKWPTTGLIQFDKVQLKYKDKTDLIFDNISFTINNSEKIGILSKTDICKTSLIDIMYRLCELNDGKIYVDSIDISQIDIKHLRNQLFTVPQNPIFFGTIRFFLDPKTRYTDAEIWSALEKVHLKDKVSLIASQLHYLIVGKTFSICEKQLFFLAKALLHHKKIVLLEENTTSEPKAMGLIHQILDKEFSSITVLIVAHYLSTVLPCNRILVMDNGRVLEFDNPSTLMNNQASNLRKMWRDGETVEGT